MEKKEKIRKIVFWVSIAVTVLMLVIIGIEIGGNLKAASTDDDIREIKNNATSEALYTEPTCEPATTLTPAVTEPSIEETVAEETTTEEATTEPETTTEEVKEILPQYKELYEINNHMVGWIKIEDTPIDYPVLEVEGDNDYYLYKDFYGNYSKPGQIIFDYRCDFEKPSTNIILHGHRMSNKTMFGSLRDYAKKSYYEKHQYIKFDTIYEEGEYEIFAVFKSKVYNNVDEVFKYYNFINADTEEEFNDYIENVKKLSLYDTGITPVFGDELLALSTCDYSQENGRLVVAARKIEKTEAVEEPETTTERVTVVIEIMTTSPAAEPETSVVEETVAEEEATVAETTVTE